MAIIIFIICLSALILIHEFGHFLVAKWNGVKVEEFGIGYPPRIFGVKKGETIYSVNWLPFGGFVKILGEDGGAKDNPRSFSHRRPGIKILILIAGIFMNLVFGSLLLGAGYWKGMPVVVDENNIGQIKDLNLSILNVSVKSPASEAGIKAGDLVISMKAKGQEVSRVASEGFQTFVQNHLSQEIILTIQRNDQILEKSIIARINPPKGEGALGVMIGETGTLKYPFWKSFIFGLRDGARLFVNIFIALFYFFKGLFVGTQSVNDMVGVVGITALGSQTVKLGLGYMLQFLAGLSINLAALNLIPFPALDGSRILFIIIEKIKGNPISQKVENLVHSSGFALLIALTIFITAKDIIRLF